MLSQATQLLRLRHFRPPPSHSSPYNYLYPSNCSSATLVSSHLHLVSSIGQASEAQHHFFSIKHSDYSLAPTSSHDGTNSSPFIDIHVEHHYFLSLPTPHPHKGHKMCYKSSTTLDEIHRLHAKSRTIGSTNGLYSSSKFKSIRNQYRTYTTGGQNPKRKMPASSLPQRHRKGSIDPLRRTPRFESVIRHHHSQPSLLDSFKSYFKGVFGLMKSSFVSSPSSSSPIHQQPSSTSNSSSSSTQISSHPNSESANSTTSPTGDNKYEEPGWLSKIRQQVVFQANPNKDLHLSNERHLQRPQSARQQQPHHDQIGSFPGTFTHAFGVPPSKDRVEQRTNHLLFNLYNDPHLMEAAELDRIISDKSAIHKFHIHYANAPSDIFFHKLNAASMANQSEDQGSPAAQDWRVIHYHHIWISPQQRTDSKASSLKSKAYIQKRRTHPIKEVQFQPTPYAPTLSGITLMKKQIPNAKPIDDTPEEEDTRDNGTPSASPSLMTTPPAATAKAAPKHRTVISAEQWNKTPSAPWSISNHTGISYDSTSSTPTPFSIQPTPRYEPPVVKKAPSFSSNTPSSSPNVQQTSQQQQTLSPSSAAATIASIAKDIPKATFSLPFKVHQTGTSFTSSTSKPSKQEKMMLQNVLAAYTDSGFSAPDKATLHGTNGTSGNHTSTGFNNEVFSSFRMPSSNSSSYTSSKSSKSAPKILSKRVSSVSSSSAAVSDKNPYTLKLKEIEDNKASKQEASKQNSLEATTVDEKISMLTQESTSNPIKVKKVILMHPPSHQSKQQQQIQHARHPSHKETSTNPTLHESELDIPPHQLTKPSMKSTKSKQSLSNWTDGSDSNEPFTPSVVVEPDEAANFDDTDPPQHQQQQKYQGTETQNEHQGEYNDSASSLPTQTDQRAANIHPKSGLPIITLDSDLKGLLPNRWLHARFKARRDKRLRKRPIFPSAAVKPDLSPPGPPI